MDLDYTRKGDLLDQKYKEYFVPTVLTAMALSMSIIVDGIIVGNLLGVMALAAVNLVMPLVMVYNTVAVLLGLGAATAIAVAKGRRENSYANDIFTVSLAALLVTGVVLMIFQISLLDEISLLLTNDKVLLPLVKGFLRILVYATPLMVLILGVVFCLRTDGKAKLASIVLVTANAVNLILDLVYIGIFGMGINGAALATFSGYAVGAATLFFYVFAKDRTLKVNFKLLSKPFVGLKYLERILVTGTPSAMSAVLVPAKLFCINAIVLSVGGSSGMVAFSVCISCLSLSSMFVSGVAQTMTPIIGVLYGEKDFAGIRFVVKRAFQILAVATILVTILLELFPENVLALFGVKHAADLAIGILAVRVFSISLIGKSFNMLMLFYYMTTEKRGFANAISVVEGFAIVVPGAFVLSKLAGTAGVWSSFIIAEVVTMAMIAGYYLYIRDQATNKYNDILLLDTASIDRSKMLDLTIRGNIDDVVGVSKKTIEFLSKGGVESSLCNKVGMVIEEMAANIAMYGYTQGKKNNYIDIRIKLLEEEFIIILRDDGQWFDPTKYLESEKKEEAYLVGGIELVKALAKQVAYARILGLNNTTITIASGK